MSKLKCCLLILAVSLFLASCGETTPRGPTLTGHLFVRVGVIHELIADPNTGTIQDTPIGHNVGNAAASPDKHFLVYAGSESESPQSAFHTYLRDLATGQERVLPIGGGYHFAWSPDSQRFSYFSFDGDRLRVYDLTTSKDTLIATPTSATYVQSGTGASIPVTTPICCAKWIKSQSLVFQRFIGSFPASISGLPTIYPNTTTLAQFEVSPVSLSDWPQPLLVLDVSFDGNYALVDASSGQGADQYAVIASFTRLLDLQQALPCDTDCRMIGFLPNSDDLFGYEDIRNEGGQLQGSQLFFINPQTLAKRKGPRLPEDWYLASSNATYPDSLYDPKLQYWVGDPKQGIICFTDQFSKALWLGNINTGGKTKLLDLPKDQESLKSPVIVWIP